MFRIRHKKLLAAAALLIVLIGGAGWLVATESGLRFLLARAAPLLPVDLDPAQANGRLLGPLSLGPVDIAGPGVTGRIERIEIDWRPAALLARTLHLRELHIVGPDLRLDAPAELADRPPESAPAGSLPRLPLTVVAERIWIRDGQLWRGDEPLLDGLQLELSGRLAADRLEFVRLNLESAQGAVSGHARLSMAPADPWDIDLKWSVPLEQSTLDGRTKLIGRLPDLALEQSLSGLLAARLEGTVRGLPQPPTWNLDLQLEPLAGAGAPWPPALDGAAARLRIEGRLEDSRVTGRLELPEQVEGPVEFDARGGWSDGDLEIRRLMLTLADGGWISADGYIAFGAEPGARFAVTGERLGWPLGAADPEIAVPRLAAQGEGAGRDWRLELDGRVARAGLPVTDLEAVLQWAGTLLRLERLSLDSPDGVLRATASGELDMSGEAFRYRLAAEGKLRWSEYPALAVELVAEGDARGAQIDSLQGDVLEGRIEGEGRIAWTGEQAADFRLRFAGLDPAGLAPDWPGSVSGRLELKGLPDATGGLELTLGDVTGTLRDLPLSGEAAANLQGGELLLRDAAFRLGSTSVRASGWFGDSELTVDAAVQAEALDELQLDARGSLVATASVSGAWPSPYIALEAQGTRLGWGSWRARALRIESELDATGVRPSRLQIALDGFASGPGPGGSLQVTGHGTPGDHRIGLQLDRVRPEQAFRIALAGGLEDKQWSGRLTELAVSEEGSPIWTLQAPAELLAGQDAVALGALCMDGTLGLFCLDGGWDRAGPWQAQALLARLDLAPLSEWLSEGLLASGVLTGQLKLTADDDGFRSLAGGLGLTAGDLRIAGEDSEALLAWQHGSVVLDGDRAAARATLSLELIGADSVDGRLVVGWNDPDPPLDGALVAILGNLQIVAELLPELAELEGHAAVTGAVAGTLRKPIVTGRFEWLDGAAEVPVLGIRPGELEVVAELQGGVLSFRAGGESGGGRFSADGHFDLAAEQLAGRATLRGEDLLLVDLPEARVAASPDLRLSFAGNELSIGGEVAIPAARISGTGGPTAVTTSQDEVLVGRRARLETEEIQVTSRVRVSVGENVHVQAAGLRGRVAGSLLTVIQPQALPWGRGELRVVDGTYTTFGQRLQIDTGRLIYTGGPLGNPGLEIRAIRKVEGVTAGALIRGTLQEPEISVYSDPPLPRAEALSYLTLGKSLDQLQAGEQRTVNQAANSLALSGGGLIARDLGRRLGFDDVAVTADDDAGASVVISKYLGGGLYVSYGLGLFDTVNTLRLRYQVNQRLSLEATSGMEAAADLFYTFERD